MSEADLMVLIRQLQGLLVAIPAMVRGQVNADGSIAAGSGFTVAKGVAGVYTITFSPALPSPPAVSALGDISGGIRRPDQNGFPTTTTLAIRIRDGAGTLADGAFSFIAIPT